MTEAYDGRQVVGMDLHRRRSVLVRMTEDGRKLETARIVNSPLALRGVWAAPHFPDSGFGAISCRTLPVQVLVVDFLRSPVAECRMETSPIIPELNVARNVLTCFPYRRVHGPVDPLDFDSGIE